MSDIAKLGFSVDTQPLKKGEKALDDFAKTGEKTEKRTDKSSKKIKDDFEGIEKAVGKTAAAQLKADKAMAQFSRRSGQAGIQFQQFIGQVQGGQGVMLALSQQSADLGFVLGAPLIGAIAGISASLIGLLIPNLIDTTSAMEDLDKAMAEVNKTATENDGVISFTKEIQKLSGESEKAARLMIMAAEHSAKEAGRAAAEGIGEEFNDAFDVTIFQHSFDALKTIAGTAGGTGFSISQEYKDLGEQFGLTGEAAKEAGVDVLVSLREMENSVSAGLPNAGEKIIAFQDKIAELAETSSGESKSKLLDFVNSIDEYVNKAKKAAEMTAFFNETVGKENLEIPTEESLKLSSAIDSITNSLESQIIALRDGEDAAINWGISQRLGLKDGEEIPASIQAQIESLKALKAQQEDDFALMSEIREEEKIWAADRKKEANEKEKARKQEEKDFESLKDKIEGFGGAWTKTGSVIVDAFGDISDAMSNYMLQLREIETNEKELAELAKNKGADNIEVITLQQKLEEDRISAELSGIKSIASATGLLFDEKTSAAKAFAAIEKGIVVAQIALTMQKMLADTTATSVEVANSGLRASAKGAEAVASAATAPWPIGLGLAAAMLAFLSSLGIMGGGGGGGGNGTGSTSTVLGGGVSESISNANESLENIMIDQLAELRGLRSDLTDVQNLSFGLLRDLLSVDVGHSEIKNATERSLEESIRGLNEGVESGEFTNALRDIFDGIGEAINESVSILGLTTSNSLSNFVFEIGTISFDELSAEEAGERLDQILSAQSDKMVESVASFVTDYQKVGEGALETLVRLSIEQVKFNDVINQLGMSLSGLSQVMQIDVAQSVIDLVGGFDEFSDLTESFVESFFSEAEQLKILEDSISSVFDSIGIEMVRTNEEFRSLIEGLDLTTKAGQELYAILLEISPSFAEFTEDLEDVSDALMEVAEEAFSMLESAIDLEKDRASAVLEAASDAHDAEIERLSALSDALDEENALRENNLSKAEDALNNSFDNEMELIQVIADAKIEAAELASEAEIEAIESASNARVESLEEEKAALESTSTALKSFISSITSSTDSDSTSEDLISALSEARTGDLTAAMNLDVSALTNLESSGFASAEEMAVQTALNANRLSELGDIAKEQLSDTELTISAIEAQITATESSAENQINAIEESSAAETLAIQELADSQIAELQEQLNTLLGIDTTVLNLNDAIQQYQDAQLAIDELGYDKEVERLEMLVDSANDVYDLHEQAYADEIERLDAILADNEALLNVALGIDTSVLSVVDAIESLKLSINNVTGSVIPSPSQIVKDLVWTGDSNPVDESASIKKEITKMSEDNAAYQLEIVKNTKSTARILQRIEFDGIPTQEA